MKRKILLSITASLTLLIGSGTVWGQRFVGSFVGGGSTTAEHGTNQTGVNDEFGAGETAKILGPTIGTGTVSAVGPIGGTSHPLASVPNIQLGSEYGKNVVIRTYTGDGYAMGWITVTVGQSGEVELADVTAANSYLAPTTINASSPNLSFSFNKFNANNFTNKHTQTNAWQNPWNASVQTVGCYPIDNSVLASSGQLVPCNRSLFGMGITYYADGSSDIDVCHHDGATSGTLKTKPATRPFRIYTSTMEDNAYTYNTETTNASGSYADYPLGLHEGAGVLADSLKYTKDDGVPLTQFTGEAMTSSKSAVGEKTFTSSLSDPDGNISSTGGDESADKIANYRRPTTIIIETGQHEFRKFNFYDIEWQFEINKAQQTVVKSGSLDKCNSGHFKYFAIQPSWTYTFGDGNSKIDGAILLKKDAIVCVHQNVKDSTQYAASVTSSFGTSSTTFSTGIPDANTDAILVLPDANTGRFTLRVGGNVDGINMTHDATAGDKYYSQADFPKNSLNVYMYSDPSNQEWTFANANYRLNNVDYTTVNRVAFPDPANKTKAAVFGVYGNYEFLTNNAKIHTTMTGPVDEITAFTPYTDGKDNNPGVIEIGNGLYNGGAPTRGYDNLNIYSGGILKNFEGCNALSNFMMNFTTTTNTPKFYMDATSPLYILNYGNNQSISPTSTCVAGQTYGTAGVLALETTISNAVDGGKLHIQALGPILYEEAFSPTVTAADNELRILSDGASVVFEKALSYKNTGTYLTGDNSFVIWAQGNVASDRSCVDNCAGSVWFKNIATIEHSDKGVSLVRSEYDDVLMANTFSYTNSTSATDNGEFIMQAGQDIYGQGDITITQAGEKSILLEAKNTIHTERNVKVDRTDATNGNITLKAGYPTFSSSADVASSWGNGGCVNNDYTSRNTCSPEIGADIWFEGPVEIDNSNAKNANTIATTLRAWNSIFIDDAFKYSIVNGTSSTTGDVLLFAETGNVEAIKNNTTSVEFNIGTSANDDPTKLQIQAGNNVDDYCTKSECYSSNAFDSNILFNKKIAINHYGKGETLISAARDIENQINGPMEFAYFNKSLEQPFFMTAGRHIETHANVKFDYAGVYAKADITMQAGRLNPSTNGCADNLCKKIERGSTLTENDGTPYKPASHTADNDFSAGGQGQGSILLFAPLDFVYKGKGDILMTTLNGNIESDPYLHGDYKAANGAPIYIDHNTGSGKTTLEAIDIRLHDVFTYDATTGSADKNNGNLIFHAFDSILTRDISYTNLTDNGNVSITTDKYKNLSSGGCSGSIMQGHIVLGYGANKNLGNDVVSFDFGGTDNTSASGANLYIKAGYEGFAKHADKKSKYGGNITYDHMTVSAALGNRKVAGYTEISTPNGNIWGKDSLTYSGFKGDLLMDAGMGSVDDPDAIAWKKGDEDAETTANGINQKILNTRVPNVCATDFEWRTGNIMMKGGSLNFNQEDGNATFRTREGYIDTYDAFNVLAMKGQLLKYAHAEDATTAAANQYGDISERDFAYVPAGGSAYYGADDNIMFNYGNSNRTQKYVNQTACAVSGGYAYDGNSLLVNSNPYYTAFFGKSKFDAQTDAAVFNVNTNGYLFYKNMAPVRNYHFLYRGGNNECTTNSGLTGTCATAPNGARDITMDFSQPNAGGFATVANNYVDFFTKFTYMGGSGSGMPNPTIGNLLYESVSGYGLFLKSRNEGVTPERRRVTCHDCGESGEWPAITFHDDARIHMEGQKVLLEAPVIDFFGHAELDATSKATSSSKFMVKADSLIFHDSAIFDGTRLQLLPFTAADRGSSANLQKRLGVMNDIDYNTYKAAYGPAIVMEDREVPVLEFGYQRCNEPLNTPNVSKNTKDVAYVGGDVIVAVKHGYELPILNTVVANHARISFIDDMIDGPDNIFYDANVRTDLLRIRNKVEFYTDPAAPTFRKGTFKMTSDDQMLTQRDAGIYPKHLHMEPGSELSIPGEDSLTIIATTTVGGYGEIHENITVKANATIAPGYASFMEYDCTSGSKQGKLTIHNLHMEKDAELRVSISNNNCQQIPNTNLYENCTQMDTLHVKDTVHFEGKIPVYVLTEDKTIEPGCYLFMIYDDVEGPSKERVKNLELVIDRYEDAFFYLNTATPGEVWLCVSSSPNPELLQYVDLPYVEGVTTTPSVGKHYVPSQKHFSFTATYTGAPYKVMAKGFYSGKNIELLGEKQADGSYKYILNYIVEPWTLAIGPDYATNFVDNMVVDGEKAKVWAHNNTLYVNVAKEEIVSIYSMTGVLHKRVKIPEGNTRMTLERGMYVVTLKDGSVHKIVIR